MSLAWAISRNKKNIEFQNFKFFVGARTRSIRSRLQEPWWLFPVDQHFRPVDLAFTACLGAGQWWVAEDTQFW